MRGRNRALFGELLGIDSFKDVQTMLCCYANEKEPWRFEIDDTGEGSSVHVSW